MPRIHHGSDIQRLSIQRLSELLRCGLSDILEVFDEDGLHSELVTWLGNLDWIAVVGEVPIAIARPPAVLRSQLSLVSFGGMHDVGE